MDKQTHSLRLLFISGRIPVPTPLFAERLLKILHADPSLPDPHRFEALSPVEWEEFTTEAPVIASPFR